MISFIVPGQEHLSLNDVNVFRCNNCIVRMRVETVLTYVTDGVLFMCLVRYVLFLSFSFSRLYYIHF